MPRNFGNLRAFRIAQNAIFMRFVEWQPDTRSCRSGGPSLRGLMQAVSIDVSTSGRKRFFLPVYPTPAPRRDR